MTQGRIQQVTDNIRLCVCELIDLEYKFDKGLLKSSESVGTYSVSYASNTMPLNKQKQAIIKTYLSNTDLLYMGV